MLQRCRNKDGKTYKSKRYGARGIKVCQRWEKFENFLKDMGLRPKGYSIDRIDSDGDYSPQNCRWATQKTQATNRKSTKIISYMGNSLCLSDWAKKIGISPGAITYRRKRGWNNNLIVSTLKRSNA
jgi:hypothetical protein